MRKKYKILSADFVKNLIEFLDEIQFDAAKENDNDSMHVVNFCSWAIEELLNSYDGYLKDKKDIKKPNPKKKSRDDYVEETFMDWNLPEMTDKEYEKLVDQFDAFLRGWEKEYFKKNPKKKSKKSEEEEDFKPNIEDVVQYMSLEEIKEYLLDDPELTDEERFELYYKEHRRVEDKKDSISYDELLRKSGIKPVGWKPKKKKSKKK